MIFTVEIRKREQKRTGIPLIDFEVTISDQLFY